MAKNPSIFEQIWGYPDSFASSAVDPITGVVKGTLHAVTDPPRNKIEKGVQLLGPGALALKRMFVDPSVGKLQESYQDAKEGHYPQAIIESMAAGIPGIGPGLMDAATTTADQMRSGKYSGAAGTAIGTAAMFMDPEGLGPKTRSLMASRAQYGVFDMDGKLISEPHPSPERAAKTRSIPAMLTWERSSHQPKTHNLPLAPRAE